MGYTTSKGAYSESRAACVILAAIAVSLSFSPTPRHRNTSMSMSDPAERIAALSLPHFLILSTDGRHSANCNGVTNNDARR